MMFGRVDRLAVEQLGFDGGHDAAAAADDDHADRRILAAQRTPVGDLAGQHLLDLIQRRLADGIGRD